MARKKVLENKTILIIEDDLYMARVYEKWLHNAGAHVLTAGGGAVGLEILETHRVDLVLLDLEMPGMSGYETLMRLRENAHTKDVPVIILSNTSVDGKNEKFKEMISVGVDDILQKYETSLAELVERISSHLKNISKKLL